MEKLFLMCVYVLEGYALLKMPTSPISSIAAAELRNYADRVLKPVWKRLRQKMCEKLYTLPSNGLANGIDVPSMMKYAGHKRMETTAWYTKFVGDAVKMKRDSERFFSSSPPQPPQIIQEEERLGESG